MNDQRINETRHTLHVWCESTGREVDAAGRVSEECAAEILGRSRATLANWRVTGMGPEFYRGRPPLYSLRDLAAYIEATRSR